MIWHHYWNDLWVTQPDACYISADGEWMLSKNDLGDGAYWVVLRRNEDADFENDEEAEEWLYVGESSTRKGALAFVPGFDGVFELTQEVVGLPDEEEPEEEEPDVDETAVFDAGEWVDGKCPRCGSPGLVRAHWVHCYPPDDPENWRYYPLMEDES